MENNENSPIIKDSELLNKKTKAVPVPEERKDIDTNKTFINNIIDAGISDQIDISAITSFTTESQSRDAFYDMIDSMSKDPTISAALETYAEDATEYNENGDIIWATSDDSDINTYINYLLNTLQANKHAYDWVYSLCKYGDLYFQLFKESEFKDDEFFGEKDESNKDKKQLNEDVKIKAYKDSDRFVHYIEAVANPAKMFELTRLGKTRGYIEADISSSLKHSDSSQRQLFNNRYSFKKNDICIYDATKFTHAALIADCNRYPEEVNLFLDDNAVKDDNFISYKVVRGQPLLYNLVKIWRELSLLENSMLLNRVTKSSIIRLINIEVGDMPKEQVGPFLQRIKALMEQKAAINTGESMSEYNNPGPIENNIYVPTHNGQGAITTGQIGGDFSASPIPDIEYFQNKFFGALRIPKQYFGLTDDAAGFSGGESLAIISSRYAKMVKRIQNTLIQALTSVINLFLIDKKQNSYIGKFTIHMQPPTTKEENDRRENTASRIQIVRDIMDLLSDIEDNTIKLKILKSLLSEVVNDETVVTLIQEEITNLENGKIIDNENEDDSSESKSRGGSSSFGGNSSDDSSLLNLDNDLGLDSVDSEETSDSESDSATLPSPDELGIDMTDNNAEI